MADNKALTAANRAKKDEFYTQLDDIASELKHYRSLFKDKIVLCNCDDPYESNFFKFFGLLHVFCGAPPPQGDEPNVQNGCLNQPTFGFPA